MKTMQVLTPTLHGALDYIAAVGLIIFPLLLGFSGLSAWLSVAGGVGLIAYSLLTDYTFSLAGVLSFKTHLILDLTAAATFAIAPFLFGWTGIVMAYYLVMSGGVIVVVTLSNSQPQQSDPA